MKLLNIIVMNEDLPQVNDIIIQQQCLHPVNIDSIPDLSEGGLGGFYNSASLQEYKELHGKIKKISGLINLELKYDPDIFDKIKTDPQRFDLFNLRTEINDCETQITNILGRKHALESRFESVKEIDAKYAEFKDFLDLVNVPGYSVLDQIVGKIPTANIQQLSDLLRKTPSLMIPVSENPQWTTFILFVFKRDTVTVNKFLIDMNFQQASIPAELKGDPHQVVQRLKRNFDTTKKEIEAIEIKQAEITQKLKNKLPDLAHYVNFQILKLESQQYFKKTERTCIISGWVPEENIESLIGKIKTATSGRFYAESVDPKTLIARKVKIPFRFSNNILIKPFELLIKAYGVPAYGNIDPTPFFAFSFMLMFGCMFGDVGDGLVLFITGLWMALTKKFKKTVRQVGVLVTYCGITSIIFGFLYGSVFGIETWIPALLIQPMRDVNRLLAMSLYFGIGMISVGILINVINAIRIRNWTKAIFDKAGLLGGFIYWSAIGLIFKSYFLGHKISGWIIFAFIGVPVILLFFKRYFEKLIGKKDLHHESLGDYIMDYVFEVYEIFSNYLANTFSYIRVGAFALSHAGLFVAIFTLVSMVKETNYGSILTWVVLIFGNILILLLEGMVVTIQTVRLEYYEFFSKFFEGEGILYKPLSLNENE